MISIQTKLKTKVNELGKREGKIILLEEELKQKIIETGRQLSNKDDEMEKYGRGLAEEKLKLERRVRDGDLKVRDLEKRREELGFEFECFRKEQEKSPVMLVRGELSEKILEIAELRGELVKTDEVKEEYRKNFDRMKHEILRLREEKDGLMKNAAMNQLSQMEMMRNQLTAFGNLQDTSGIDRMRGELKNLQTNYNTADGFGIGFAGPQVPNKSFENGVKGNGQQAGNNNGQKENIMIDEYDDTKSYGGMDLLNSSGDPNLQRLLQERDQLLNTGYGQDDPFITELDGAIKTLRSSYR